ncbi:MAG: hypothetical protein WAZ94_13145 [Phycisphaerales bacterium]
MTKAPGIVKVGLARWPLMLALLAGGVHAAPTREQPAKQAQPETAKGEGTQAADARPTDAQPADAKPEEAKKPEPRMKADLLGAFSARSIGPAVTGGRIGDIVVNPANRAEIYAAVASGGVWKSTSGGVTWSPIFEGEGSYSIGCLALDPSNPSVLWVGSGENNSQRSVSWGDGVYVSRDSGKSFTNMGLRESEHIGMIRVDPRNSDVVFVAAQGPLWKTGGERGLYRTADGGKTWERVLHVDDDTGVSEVHLDPRNPDVMYASSYQRRRHVWTLINGGPGSGVHKSTDGGKTWRAIDKGLPGGDRGRIGLAVSPANPDVLYAIVEAPEGAGGVFRSLDRGESWEKRSSYMTSSPQYYNELVPHPTNADTLYFLDTVVQISTDGGASVRSTPLPNKHVDSHALWIDPTNPAHMLEGNDGGLYETWDTGETWRMFTNISIAQFYKIAVDNSEPFYWVYGGTQDNNTVGGPSRTFDDAGVRNEDWFVTTGGDGFDPAVDPMNPDIVYSQWQHGGLVRFDRRSGEAIDIKPREREGDEPNVWNWDSPLLISPHDPARLYFAGRKLFRSDDRGNSWRAVSPELHRGLDRNTLEVMGKVQTPEATAKHMSTSIYGNCVALSESPLVEGLLYVGTDDGLVHVSENGGESWRRIENFPVVPERTYVSCLTASPISPDTVFATFDNHKMGDFKPYVLRSDDRGVTWKPITGDLPERNTCYSIRQDPVKAEMLFVGTEYGAFVTLDGGEKWWKVPGLPTISVKDVELQTRECDLVLGTFGRGVYISENYAPLRELSEELLAEEAHLFAARDAVSYVPWARLGSTKGCQGSAYYAAANPPVAATFTYYLKDGLKGRRQQRKDDKERDLKTNYPSIEELRAEDRELEPKVFMEVRDEEGARVTAFGVGSGAGLHRATWNLKYPSARPAGSGDLPDGMAGGGPLAPAGDYSVTLLRRVDGVNTIIAGPVPFRVKTLDRAAFAARGEAAAEKFAYQREVQGLQRAVEAAAMFVGEVQERIGHIRRALATTPGLAHDWSADLERLRLAAEDARIALRGDPVLGKRAEPEPPSIAERVSIALDETLGNTQPPTGTMREQHAIAKKQFEMVMEQLVVLRDDLKTLEAGLDAAGAPPTPGRFPVWPVASGR